MLWQFPFHLLALCGILDLYIVVLSRISPSYAVTVLFHLNRAPLMGMAADFIWRRCGFAQHMCIKTSTCSLTEDLNMFLYLFSA